MLALSSMRVFSTSFSLHPTWTSVSLIGVDQRAELLLPPRRDRWRLRVHVADLLIGKLQEFIGAGLEGGGGERLKGIAQLILVGGAAAGGEQPSGGETRDQRGDDDNSDFQRSQCNLPICQARSKAVRPVPRSLTR